jgi:hypothetical protein
LTQLVLLKWLAIFPKVIGFKISMTKVLIKIPMLFFTETEEKNPQIHMEAQKTLNSQSNPE